MSQANSSFFVNSLTNNGVARSFQFSSVPSNVPSTVPPTSRFSFGTNGTSTSQNSSVNSNTGSFSFGGGRGTTSYVGSSSFFIGNSKPSNNTTFQGFGSTVSPISNKESKSVFKMCPAQASAHAQTQEQIKKINQEAQTQEKAQKQVSAHEKTQPQEQERAQTQAQAPEQAQAPVIKTPVDSLENKIPVNPTACRSPVEELTNDLFVHKRDGSELKYKRMRSLDNSALYVFKYGKFRGTATEQELDFLKNRVWLKQ